MRPGGGSSRAVSWEGSSLPKPRGTETISDPPSGSPELFATCQSGNHLLQPLGTPLPVGCRRRRRQCSGPPQRDPGAPRPERSCRARECIYFSVWVIFCLLALGGRFLFLAWLPKRIQIGREEMAGCWEALAQGAGRGAFGEAKRVFLQNRGAYSG